MRRRLAPLAAAIIAVVLAVAPLRAPAQVMSWWLGGEGAGAASAGADTTPGMAETISWWLGAGKSGSVPAQQPAQQPARAAVAWWLGSGTAAGGAAGSAAGEPARVVRASTVSWWLGSEGAGTPAEPVPARQTLNWWLGSAAEAEDTAPAPTPAPAADRPANVPPDYNAWAEIRRFSEEAVANPDTPNLTLERLRADIVKWREQFLSAQNANRTRIDTIRSQIAALGAAPADGETEAPEIAARRAALNEQLTTLQAPGIAAEEAYLGADGLIREIDTILRERQANELLKLGPSPLVPLNWPSAYAALSEIGNAIWTETRENWASTTSRAVARENLPLTLLYLVLALALLARGRAWSERLAARFLAGSGRRAKRVVLALLISLGQVILPFVGVLLLVTSAFSTGLVGPRASVILEALPMLGFVILSARWLGQQVFPRVEETALLPGLSAERRAEGRFYATLLGLLLSLAGLLAATVPYSGDTLAARVVLGFPVMLLGGLILVRMGQILIGAGRAENMAGAISTRGRLLFLIGRAAVLLGIVGPLLAAIGYYMAGRFLVFPAALSLALLAFLVILQQLVTDFYALATRRGDDDEEALVPVLIGFALTLGALPVLALIWGARVSDLTELWARAREGFSFGETRIAPTDFLVFAAVFMSGYLATRLVQGALRTSVLPKTRIDAGGQTALVSGVGYLGIFLAAIIAITSAGINLSSLAIVAGALSVGIGFGLQNIVSNFISGIILLIERPISEGDWIDVGGNQGYVRDISVRSTRIETFDRTDVIVPNSEFISGVVTNFTRGNLSGRIIVPVGVAYGTDTRKVEAILREIAEAHPLVTLSPPPAVLFVRFGADSLDFEIRAILRDVNLSMSTKSDLNHEIARRFAEEGIEIPFAQRDIWLRNPEVLTGARQAPKRKRQNEPDATEAAPAPAPPLDPRLQDPSDAEEN